jgi:hypothetical protein
MASMLAGVFAVPVGIFLAGRAEITLAFTLTSRSISAKSTI